MIKHTQMIRHKPELGQFGDCHRTALASILNLSSPEDAPHFIGEYERLKAEGSDGLFEFNWMEQQEEWLNSLGYTSADVIFNGELPLSDLFFYMQDRNPHTFYLLGGQSPRGTNHTVVACGGGFYHDPHPDGGFLVALCDNGVWEVTFILPLIMKDAQ